MGEPLGVGGMHLLHLTLQRPGYIHAAAFGNFSSPKAQEIVVIRGTSYLELLRTDVEKLKVTSICTINCFCVLRTIMSFRQVGTNKDYIVVGSDTGRITVLEYAADVNDFRTVHCETFGKTGCRRIVPGEYLAADPLGRAIMISALEKQKLVYVMNRDAAGRLTISSPLEAHKSQAIVYSTVGLDVGTENPIFATIERDYADADQDPSGEAAENAIKTLVYYELDLGLNHVIRKWSQPIASTAFMLLQVPGERAGGPGGVLVVSENWVAYTHQDHPELRTPLPRREGLPPERGTLIVSAALHKQKDLFFYLIQSEYGDLYKVTLDLDPANREQVVNVNVLVFDTVPVANGLCITKTGLLFVGSEFGDHLLYQFQGIGGDDPTAVQADSLDEKEVDDEDKLGDTSRWAAEVAATFKPGKLKNLAAVDVMPSLAPITDMMVTDLAQEDAAQIYSLCGRGGRSALRVLRHGLQVTEEASSDLPGVPNGVWTIKARQEETTDRFIVVSFTNATLVFGVGDRIEEVTDSGFLGTAPTLQITLLADNSMLQVHTQGIRHVRPGRPVSEWKTPARKQVERASANERQVVVSLEGGTMVYFELDATGALSEVYSREFGERVTCLDLGPVPAGRLRSPFLAVGSEDNTVRILSTEEPNVLSQRGLLQVSARPESVCLAEMQREHDTLTSLFINVGLTNGILQRLLVDPTEGTLSDSRQRFLGPRPVKLVRLLVQGTPGVLAISSRSWLSYNHQGRYFLTPLSYQSLECAASFANEYIPEGVIAVSGNSLKILTIQNYGNMFNQTEMPLRYTPRKMVQVPGTNRLVVIESDQHEFNEMEKAFLTSQDGGAEMEVDGFIPPLPPPPPPEDGTANGGEEGEDEEGATGETYIRGPLPPSEGKWASCIRVVDSNSLDTLELVELANNETAISVCTVAFHDRGGEVFTCVGTVTDLFLHPRKQSACAIHVYRLFESRLVLLHKTPVEDIPKAMTEFKGFGRLLVGVGKSLKMYDLGKKQLLRKAENRTFPNMIMTMHTLGDRIFVTDVLESIFFVKYRRAENALVAFADDTIPRPVTASCLVDYDTIAIGDKLGNVAVIRLPSKVSDDVDNPTGNRVLWDSGLLNGAPNKVHLMAHFYVGETITGVSKVALVPGGQEVILYTTIMGTIGALLPFASRRTKDFFFVLEMEMRKLYDFHFKRDHIAFRSFFHPVKEVLDGDLCEQYSALPAAKQRGVALGRTPIEIMKLLEDTRNSLC